MYIKSLWKVARIKGVTGGRKPHICKWAFIQVPSLIFCFWSTLPLIMRIIKKKKIKNIITGYYVTGIYFNPLQDGLFWACSRMGGESKKVLLPKVCHIYPTMMKLSTHIPYLKKIKKYINHVIHPLSSADVNICLLEISKFCYVKKYRYVFWYIVSNSFNLFWVLKGFFDKHGYNFDDVSNYGYSRSS